MLNWRTNLLAGTGAALKPLNKLTALLADLDPSKPTAVHCKSGYRSSIGTSLLERAGYCSIMNVVGGFDAWQTQKLPVALSKPAQRSTAPPQPGAGTP